MDKFRVLIVDDEVDFVETLVKRLIDRGLEVDGVNSGKAALEIIDTKDFDVIVLDVKMPGMDGIETLRENKKEKTGNGSYYADRTWLRGIWNSRIATRGL